MKTKCILLCGTIFALCAAGMALKDQPYDIFGQYWWQDALIALWPVIMGLLALSLTKLTAKIRKWWICSLYLVYFVIAGLGVICLTWHRVPWLRFEITETVYLILSADIALWSVSTESIFGWETASLLRFISPGCAKNFILAKQLEIYFFRIVANRARLINSIGANLIGAYLLTRQDRVWDILFGRTGFISWLEYRAEMFTPDIDYTAVIIAAAIILLLIPLMRALPVEHRVRPIFKGTALCLAARSAIGLACRIFGVSSSGIGVLLSCSAWDIISIAALLIMVPVSIKMKEAEANECTRWLRQGPLKALGAAKPSAAAHAQGSIDTR